MSKKSIALGTFDGLHIGHMAVIEKAKQSEYPLSVLMFNKHPLEVLTGKAPAKLLSDGVFERLCTENSLICHTVDFERIVDMTPEEFFYEILINELNAGEITCGENYSFGKGGSGNCETLKSLCEKNGIIYNVIKTVRYQNEPVSSTRIRRLIENGEIEAANRMLKRPFSYSFPVVDGRKLGRKLNFPTANQIIPEEFVQMKYGVYASAVELDGTLYSAVTNFGCRPTVGGSKPRSETYINGFSGNLYGRQIEIRILKFLRPERKFSNIDELSRAILKDCEISSEIFNNSLEILR